MDKSLQIIKIHIIRFGGLAEQVFSFQDGINVIYGQNRSGKTTLCEFIRFMFYGFEGRDPEDYYPYDSKNPSVCGSMTVKYGSKMIEIFRENNTSTQTCAMTDIDRGQPYAPENFSSPGQHFMGITADLYDCSLYCPQGMTGDVSSGNLINHQEQLMKSYSGESHFSGLIKKLRHQRFGLINPEKTGKADLAIVEREKLEGELASAIIKQNEIMNIESVIAATSDKLLEVEKKRVIAKADLENLANLHAEENNRRRAAAEQSLNQKRELAESLSSDIIPPQQLAQLEEKYLTLSEMGDHLENLEGKLANTKSNLEMHITMVNTEEYTQQTLEDISVSLQKRDKLSKALIIASLPLFVVSAVVFGILFLLAKDMNFSHILLISGILLAMSLCCAVGAIIVNLSKGLLYKQVGVSSAEDFEDAYDLSKSLAQTTNLYRSTYQDEARAYKEKAVEYSKALRDLAQALGLPEETSSAEQLRTALDDKKQRSEQAHRAYIDYQKEKDQYQKLICSDEMQQNDAHMELLHKREQELNQYTAQEEELYEKKRSLEGIFSTAIVHTERPAYIKTRINQLNRQIQEYQRDAQALDIAYDVAKDAISVMKFRIKNHLTDSVNHHMKFALKENESFVLDDNYCLQYKNSGHLCAVFTNELGRGGKSAKGISRSLCEMAAISLRLALVELLESESSAAILDEPFAFVDSQGEQRMLKKLSACGLSQVFVFTSHQIQDLPNNCHQMSL